MGSYRIGKIFGIDIEIHFTFILVLLFIFLYSSLFVGGGLVSGISALIYFAILFTLVILHELAHSAVAIVSGIRVSKITLLPIGGVATMEIPEKPSLELVMAIAGPLLNFTLAFIFLIPLVMYSIVTDHSTFASGLSGALSPKAIFSIEGILLLIIAANLVLGSFNLLPIFPMDGGRIFRAILAFFMDYVDATEIAVILGQFMSVLMTILGFVLGNIFLVLIGILIFFAGDQELKVVKLRHSLKGIYLRDVTLRDLERVPSNMTLAEFFRNKFSNHIFYAIVDDQDEIHGYLDLRTIPELKDKGIMQKKIEELSLKAPILDINSEVSDVLLKLLESDFVFVSENGKIIGYTFLPYVIEFGKIRKLLRSFFKAEAG